MTFTSKQAAEVLGLSVRSVQKLAKDRKLGTLVKGRNWEFTLADLDAMNDRRPSGRPKAKP